MLKPRTCGGENRKTLKKMLQYQKFPDSDRETDPARPVAALDLRVCRKKKIVGGSGKKALTLWKGKRVRGEGETAIGLLRRRKIYRVVYHGAKKGQ